VVRIAVGQESERLTDKERERGLREAENASLSFLSVLFFVTFFQCVFLIVQ